MDAQSPTVGPLKYVLIPADDTAAPIEMRFPGGSDDELRATIKQYFRRQLLSQDQKNEMKKHLMEKARKSEEHGEEKVAATVTIEQRQDEMIADYLEETSFEIVPLLMPGRENKYIGTSLYIDDSGRFKDLSLNQRASKIAQRDIRGDAFLLSNHDDPALDEWSRTDCTLATYEALLANPPMTNYDASNQAQMASLASVRESDTRRISEQDALKAKQSKDEGNTFFSAGNLEAAVQAYTLTAELTEGRRDLLPNEAELTALRISAFLNRSLCLQRMGKYDDAALDAQAAIQLDPTNIKAYNRLAVALCGSRDYAAATEAVKACEALGGVNNDTRAIRHNIAEGKKKLIQEEKQKYSKMFA